MMSNQPYQGYPYVTVSYTDAPSIDAATASQWTNLPVKPGRTVRSPLEDQGPKNTINNTSKPPRKNSLQDNPVIYIDLPENQDSYGIQPETPQEDASHTSNKPDEIPPIVYYNPYADDEVTASANNQYSAGFHDSHVGSSSGQRGPPSNLTVNSPVGSSSSSWNSPATSQPTSSYDAYLSKETQVYTPSYPADDGFNLASIPVSEFPDPPPAYAEVDRAPVAQVVEAPPQTQVIVNVNRPEATSVPVNPHRQLLDCQHCGARVYSLVIKENGLVTHAIACLLLFLCLLPLIYLVYCLDFCKYRNHYCPNCNQLIGYEVCCQKTVYAK